LNTTHDSENVSPSYIEANHTLDESCENRVISAVNSNKKSLITTEEVVINEDKSLPSRLSTAFIVLCR
jgi:hypothetical protein